MRRFLRDAAVALFVGAVLVALAMVFKPLPDEASDGAPAPVSGASSP